MAKAEANDIQDIINVRLKENYKREKCKEEADEMIQRINQHLTEKAVEMNAIDTDRLDTIQKIHESTRNGDLKQLEKLFERLR